MQFFRISGAKCWSILRKKSTGLEPDTTGVAQRLWSQRPGSPLWSLLHLTVHTSTAGNRTAVRIGFTLLFLGRRFFRAGKPLGVVNRVREHERRQSGGAVRRRCRGWVGGTQRRRRQIPRPPARSRPLAPSFNRNRRRDKWSQYSMRRSVNRFSPVLQNRSVLPHETSGGAQ